MPYIRNSKKIKITLQDDEYDCAPASLRMFLSYKGIKYRKATIKKLTMTSRREGTDDRNIVDFLKTIPGFEVFEYEGKNNLTTARKLLSENEPLFLCYDMFGNQKYSHYAVCIGMKGRKIYLLNPYSNKKEEVKEEYHMKWFREWWKTTNFWFLVLRKIKK